MNCLPLLHDCVQCIAVTTEPLMLIGQEEALSHLLHSGGKSMQPPNEQD